MTCILLLHLSKRQPWTTEPLSIFGKRRQPTAGQRHRPFKAFCMVRNPERTTTRLPFSPPPNVVGSPGSHTWHYAHARHRHFQPSSEVLCSRPTLMINAKCWEKKFTRYVLVANDMSFCMQKLDSCVRGASPFHQAKNTKWRCIIFPLASIFVGFVRFKWSCSATHLLTKKGRIISPNMKNGNSTNDSNCHGKLLPQTLETARSPILQVFDRGVYDSHYLNCSAMLGELLFLALLKSWWQEIKPVCLVCTILIGKS